MNAYRRALRDKKRYGCLLLAFHGLYGEDNITKEMVFGITEAMGTFDSRDLNSIAEDFAQVDGLVVVADIPTEEGEKLGISHFDVNRHFPIAMNTRDTVGVLFGDDFSCCVLGYDIKHELIATQIKLESAEKALKAMQTVKRDNN